MAVHQRVHPPPLVIVVAFHNTEDLRRCLNVLDGWGELVVVDNGGDDEVAPIVRTAGGRYLRQGLNLGFAAAVNLALAKRLPSQHVLLLNPDAVLDPSSADVLVEELDERPSCAAVAPRLRGRG